MNEVFLIHNCDVTPAQGLSNHRQFHCLFNSQVPDHWFFVRESINSTHKGPMMWKAFPRHYVAWCLSSYFNKNQSRKEFHDMWSVKMFLSQSLALRWRHNERTGVSNHQPHDCLLNRLFRPRSKKTSKLRVTYLCAGNSPETREFPAQMASNAENVSIWWRHHGLPEIWAWTCNYIHGFL